MKEPADNEDMLRTILKENGFKKPDEQFSGRLKHLLVEKYRHREAHGLERNQWPARMVLSMAIVWCSILLYYISPFIVNPIGFTVFTFLLGLWAVIILVRKNQHLV
jgi:hypothetical protein